MMQPRADEGTSDNLTSAKKGLFLAALRNKGTLRHACEAADISRDTAWRWRKNDPEFGKACDDAVEDSTDVLEDSLYERALHGDGMPAVISTIATLKARRPQKWSEKHLIVHANDDPATAMMKAFMERLSSRGAKVSLIEGTATEVNRAEGEQQA